MHTEESQRRWDESQERQVYTGFGTAAEPLPKRGTNKIPKKKKRKKK